MEPYPSRALKGRKTLDWVIKGLTHRDKKTKQRFTPQATYTHHVPELARFWNLLCAKFLIPDLSTFFVYIFKNTFTNNNIKRPKQVGRTGHLELLTTSSHFGTLVHVIFLTTVFCQRMHERCVCLCISLESCEFLYVLAEHDMLLNATYPCLLSSSGSGPVELEHRAQLLSASEDFILRKQTKKKTTIH